MNETQTEVAAWETRIEIAEMISTEVRGFTHRKMMLQHTPELKAELDLVSSMLERIERRIFPEGEEVALYARDELYTLAEIGTSPLTLHVKIDADRLPEEELIRLAIEETGRVFVLTGVSFVPGEDARIDLVPGNGLARVYGPPPLKSSRDLWGVLYRFLRFLRPGERDD